MLSLLVLFRSIMSYLCFCKASMLAHVYVFVKLGCVFFNKFGRVVNVGVIVVWIKAYERHMAYPRTTFDKQKQDLYSNLSTHTICFSQR